MIESIKLKGFQSHTASFFHLGPGLNVITGPSDSGKTAIIRAVKWVAFNEPTGEAFLNQTVGEAEVEIVLTDGVTITKRRKNKKTTYQLSTIPEPFEKSEVPQEVKEALGITKQTFGDFVTSLNFAFQLEAPFLISETASAGAKILGKLAGTEAVDMAIKDVSKDTYAARQERSQAEKEIEKIEYQLGEFINLEDLKEQLEACEYLAQQIEAAASKVDKLKQLKIAFGNLTDQIERHQDKLDRLAIVGDLEEEIKNVEAAQARYDKLLTIYSQLNRTTAALKAASYQLVKLEGVGLLAAQLGNVEVSNQRVVALKSMDSKHKVYTAMKKSYEETIEKMAGLEEAESLLETIRKAYTRKADLRTLQLTHEVVSRTVVTKTAEIAKFDGLTEADNILQSTANDQARIMELRSLRAKHRLDIQDAMLGAQKAAAAALMLETAKEELAATWEAAGGICPLCDQALGSHSLYLGGHSHE
jgi:exonuclease SbcC